MTKLRVGLLWHSFSSNNLGVIALSMSNISIIEAACHEIGVECEFKVWGTVGAQNYIPGHLYMNTQKGPISLKDLLTNRRSYRRHLVAEFKMCDVVFDIGEGDSFADVYGWRRFLVQELTKVLVVHSATPLVLSPQTIGPFRSFITKSLANYVVRRSRRVFVRDNLSFKYLIDQDASLANVVEEASDVAFVLPWDSSIKQKDTRDVGVPRVKIGLNVSGLLYHGGYNKKNQFNLAFCYKDFVLDLLNLLTEDKMYEVHLIPHVVSGKKDTIESDYEVSVLLGRKFPNAKVAPRFKTPIEAKSYISRMDFFTGARMHATIAALSSGVPVVPVAYTRKATGLFGSLEYHHIVDATVDSKEDALQLILESIQKKEQLREDVVRTNEIASRKLEKYICYVRHLLEEINHEKHTHKTNPKG